MSVIEKQTKSHAPLEKISTVDFFIEHNNQISKFLE